MNDPAPPAADAAAPAPPQSAAGPTPAGPAGGNRLPWRTEVLLLLALALLLRALKIAVTEPWLDEACSIELARHGPAALLHTLASSDASPHPPLYFLLLSGFIGLLGDALGPVRLPSLFAGLALVGLTAEAGRRLAAGEAGAAAGRWVGRLAGLIAALSPLGIHYSVEARGYGLLAFLSLGLALAVERYLATGSRRHLIWLAALGLAASLTHYFALFLLPLPLVLAGWQRARPRFTPDPIRRAGVATAVLLLVMQPGLWLVIGQLQRGAGGTSWLRPLGSVWAASLASLEAMAVGTQLPKYLGHAGLVRVSELMHALGLAFMGGGALLASLWPLPEAQRRVRRALVTLIALAVGAPLLLSLWKPLYLPGRYELAAMAPLHALAAFGWWQVLRLVLPGSGRRRDAVVGWLIALLVVGLSTAYLPRYLQLNTIQPFSLVNMTIQRGATPKSAVILTRLTGPPTAWQLRQTDFPGITRYFPAVQGRHPCWLDPASMRDPQLPGEALALAEELKRAGMRRLFIVVSLRRGKPYPAERVLFAALKGKGWAMRGSRHAGPYGIAIWEPKR